MILRNNSQKKLYTLTLATSLFLCCFNASMVTTNSSETATEPDVNFYGMLEDHAHIAPVEAILIGGRYETIPVYQKIDLKKNVDSQDNLPHDIDPKQNKTFINLQDVKSIALEHPNNPAASSIQINGKTYIQIIIELLHGSKKKYLVESTRKINCKEIDKGEDVEEKLTMQARDINFIHVKKLTIKGHRSNNSYKAIDISPSSKETIPSKASEKQNSALMQQKANFQNNAAELLHTIEENVKNLPMDNASAFETMRSTILTLLKSLRDQLQKFLDMIK